MYLDLGQQLGLFPVLKVIVVVATLCSHDQMPSCWVKEHLVNLSFRDLSGDLDIY